MYDFIKDVKVIDEYTIEYETYAEVVYELPKELKTVEDSNYTYGLIGEHGQILIYINGNFVWRVKRIDILKQYPDVPPYPEQLKYSLRLTFAEKI